MNAIIHRLLAELAEDAQDYLEVLRQVRAMPEGSERRDDLEGELYALVVALKLHAEGVQKEIDAHTDALPLEREVA